MVWERDSKKKGPRTFRSRERDGSRKLTIELPIPHHLKPSYTLTIKKNACRKFCGAVAGQRTAEQKLSYGVQKRKQLQEVGCETKSVYGAGT